MSSVMNKFDKKKNKHCGGEGENGERQFGLVFFYQKKSMKQTLFWRRQNVPSNPKQTGVSFTMFKNFCLADQPVE